MMEKKPVERVIVSQNGAAITARAICQDPSGLQFAFYLSRNEERFKQIWYSASLECSFDIDAPGYYRVACFAKNGAGEIQTVKSAPVFSLPRQVTADTFPGADPSAVAFRLSAKHWPFPALYYPKDGKRLFVMTPSAVNRETITLPAFSRWTWKDAFPGDVLCIADPTLELHKDLRLGWLLGHKDKCATDELVPFIVNLARARGIDNKDIVFWGSSAGGFAALALAARVEGSVAVAINSQTDALSYEITRQVALVRQTCFDDMPEQDIRSRYADRVSMIAKWASNRTSRAFLVQNELDVHHYEAHFKPLWASFGGHVREGLGWVGLHKAWVYRDAKGHIPESREMASEILGML